MKGVKRYLFLYFSFPHITIKFLPETSDIKAGF